MPQTSVYQSVAAEASGRKNYDPIVHSRVDALVEEYIGSVDGARLRYAAGEDGFAAEVEDCTEWVKEQYKERYGNERHVLYGCPVLGWLLMTIFGGIISWLVQRTLEEKFPRGPKVYGSAL